MKISRIVLLIVFAVSWGCTASYSPSGLYAEDVIGEISQSNTRYKSEAVKTLNLQNKPLAFASEQYIFDYGLAGQVVGAVVQKFPNLEVLDLSLNRLPENALPSFLPLLEKESFKFLDVRINSGANSLAGLQYLADSLTDNNISREMQVPILRKIIWLSEDFLERVNIPQIYKDAHRDYYTRLAETSSTAWTLPS